MESILQSDPSLTPKEKEEWIKAQRIIKAGKLPPLKTVTQTSAGVSFGNQKRVEETTAVKLPS